MPDAILIGAAVVFVVLLVGLAIVGPAIIDRDFDRQIQRNNEVYQYRIGLIAQITAAATEDAQARRPYQWRYVAYDSVSYTDMANSRQPLDTFYPDKSFLDPEATGPATNTAQKGR